MKDLVKKAGLENDFLIESAATSSEEIGNPVYPPARRMLMAHGMDCSAKRARQMTRGDYSRYDLFIGMDYANKRNMLRLFDYDPEGKVHLLFDYTPNPREVSDPWYTDDFVTAWEDIEEGCKGLLEYLKERL